MSFSPSAFERFADLLRRTSGLTIGPEKAGLLEARLCPVMNRHQITDLNTLATRIGDSSNPGLIRDVVEAMTTHESSFFRDGKPFAHLISHLPYLQGRALPGERLRIWSAAASYGQEAYSIAMTLLENATGDPAADIIATDISRPVVARAAEGTFSAVEVQRGLSQNRLNHFFEPCGGEWRAKPALRKMTTFKEWNILHDCAPLGMFDVIFCRNVLIYFDQVVRRRVLAALAARLKPNGLLYLGCTETILEPICGLIPVKGECAIWQQG